MKTAIIIDDELKGRIALSQKLHDYCNDVYLTGEAERGEEGIKLIEKLQPDIVFLDIEMPRMDGFDMLHRLPKKILILYLQLRMTNMLSKPLNSRLSIIC